MGSYPDASLTSARKARGTTKLQKASGINPVQVRQIEQLKALTAAGDAFKATALE